MDRAYECCVPRETQVLLNGQMNRKKKSQTVPGCSAASFCARPKTALSEIAFERDGPDFPSDYWRRNRLSAEEVDF